MKKRIYWKDIGLSFTKSKGRFFSIFSLMMIGAIALVGLKVTTPNMEQTAQEYVEKYRMMDMAVMADYGLSDADMAELSAVKGAEVEFGYLADTTIADSNDAVRIFSVTDKISRFEVLSGRLPEAKDEIALLASLSRHYKIGDRIVFTKTDKSPLAVTEFTITGFVNSSEIWNPQAMGSSNVGTGELTAYAVASPQAFDSDVYLIARLLYSDITALPYYQNQYQLAIAQYQKDLVSTLADNGADRLASLKKDGQKEIADGWAEIEQSEKDLADADQKIKDGEAQIADGQGQLATAKSEVEEGETSLVSSNQDLQAAKVRLDETAGQLASAKQQLDVTAGQLATAKSDLDSNKATLDETKGQLDAAASQLATAKSSLDENKSKLDAAAGQISDGQFQLQQAKVALQEQIDALIAAGQDPTTIPEILAAQTQIAEQEAALDLAMQEYEAGFAQYQEGFQQYSSQLAEYESGQAQYESGLAQYNAGLAQYESGLAQYQSGLAQYQSGLAQYQSGQAQYESGLAQYQAGRARIASAKEELSQQEAKLIEAQAELDASKETYEAEAADAQQKIKDAKADLEKAQTDLDKLAEPAYNTYTRASFPGGSGYETYRSATESISAVGNIFPVVLYLVAALVTFTTMTRFVDEERNNAGILRALGYTNKQIIAKFVIYGLVSSLLGTAVGILAGNLVLSPIIGNIITKSTVIGQARLYFYLPWTLLAIGLALISAVLPAYLVARKELTEEPAQLLLGKPPVSGSTILLEKISFIWKRMSFTHKVTARNIFRYKQRMLMTIFGVAGSVALLFAGLGIQSSISGVVDTQFGQLIGYDMIVAQNKDASQEALEQVDSLVQSTEIKQSQSIQFFSLTESIPTVKDDQYINLIVTESPAISDFIQLRTRKRESISLTNQGAVLSEKLASLYDVAPGDTVTISLDNQPVQIQVAAISEMYAGHFIYMTADYYETVSKESYQANAYLLSLKDSSSQQIQASAADFLALDGVAGVAQNTALIAVINTVASSLQSVMLILIALSVLLAVVILYNLTNINVAERIRELSTIKVLGFHNKEVTMYIYRETILLSLIGIVTGLSLGYVLHKMILNMIGTSALMFSPTVGTWVYLIPIFAIMGILTLLGFMVNYKLRRVDMLEALKSVE